METPKDQKEKKRERIGELLKEKRELRQQIVSELIDKEVKFKCKASSLVESDLPCMDDEISFSFESEAETGNNDYYSILVRNNSLEGDQRENQFDFNFSEATITDMEQYIKDNEAYQGGIGQYKSLIDLTKNEGSKYKVYCLKDLEQSITCIAGGSISGDHFNIASLNTNHSRKKKGIGSYFISELKKRFKSMSLSAVPHDKTDERAFEDRERDLKRFYLRNGFVGARDYSAEVYCVHDKHLAGESSKIKYNPKSSDEGFQNVGIDGKIFRMEDFNNRLLSLMAAKRNHPGFKKIDEDLPKKLKQWEKINSEMDELSW